jgi:FkbM family methyltransferase
MSLLNRKYLFVHINKSCGGVITNNLKKNGLTEITGKHRSLKDMLYIAENDINLSRKNLFMFTIVRNPWERMLSMYLFYHKNNYNAPEYFSGDDKIDNDFNNWIEYIYSSSYDKTKIHSCVNIFKYCFSNQLNWVKDSNDNIIENINIYKIEELDLKDFFEKKLNLHDFDSDTRIHPTKHRHYSYYYNEKSKNLVSQHYQEDIDYFGYKYVPINAIKSYSQYKQEEFVINYFNNKKDGVFIELGGLDGIRHSNTFLLEKKYNWSGLIIEPSPSLYTELKMNRNVFTENILVGDKKQENVDSLYIEDKTKCIGLQGVVKNYHPTHLTRAMRELNNKSYEIIKMDMVPLQQLCDKHNISKVDYLSLDVEGSELKVLEGIDFAKLDITLIGVEINYNDDKGKIYDILNKNGYTFLQKCGDYFFTKNR